MIVWDNDNPTPFEDMIGQVICGDCLDVMKHIPDKSVDLVLTDPPYGIGKADWDSSYIKTELVCLSKSRYGVVMNCGEKNLPDCINAFAENFRGLFYGWNGSLL